MCFNSNLQKTIYQPLVDALFVNNIFDENVAFEEKVFTAFNYQYHENRVYSEWCDALNVQHDKISFNNLPFLPISFFKTHSVVCGSFSPQAIFESSGTTQQVTSKHFVKDIGIYKKSFLKIFELFYGDVKTWCIIGLLPSYLERKNSSLVMMTDELIKKSQHAASGFYLYDFNKMRETLQFLEDANEQTLLIGVAFALLDFAEANCMKLRSTVVMETGGMKGRKKELTRQQLHEIIKYKLGIQCVHSEYGMTEMLSQAYSKCDGRFFCPPWMKVFVRDEEDPLRVSAVGRGALNIIDLANIYSCCFIATEDVGIVYEDGSFEVLGRIDNSDLRGCSLLVV